MGDKSLHFKTYRIMSLTGFDFLNPFLPPPLSSSYPSFPHVPVIKAGRAGRNRVGASFWTAGRFGFDPRKGGPGNSSALGFSSMIMDFPGRAIL